MTATQKANFKAKLAKLKLDSLQAKVDKGTYAGEQLVLAEEVLANKIKAASISKKAPAKTATKKVASAKTNKSTKEKKEGTPRKFRAVIPESDYSAKYEKGDKVSFLGTPNAKSFETGKKYTGEVTSVVRDKRTGEAFYTIKANEGKTKKLESKLF